ncbi:hypothetical protein [Acuticoccus kandeliae]|uniref:hypothetical protein n=1 Tax=Acuticoccus kandeliae TaxID=2073160 RepID=UPI000D3E8CBB|nr:hypothetical protein [Acuticoccus kandeliae]
MDAAFPGQRETVDHLLMRLRRQDSAAVQVLMATQLMSQALERTVAPVAGRKSSRRAVEFVRPPLAGVHKVAAVRIVDRWTHACPSATTAAIAGAAFRTGTMPEHTAAATRDVLYRIVSQASAR